MNETLSRHFGVAKLSIHRRDGCSEALRISLTVICCKLDMYGEYFTIQVRALDWAAPPRAAREARNVHPQVEIADVRC